MAIPTVRIGPDIFFIKRGDRQPQHTHQCRDRKTSEPVSLMAATGVQFILRKRSGAPGTAIVGTAKFVTKEKGEVAYEWGASDTSVPGSYWAEYKVTFSDGTERTFPQEDYLEVEIEADLNTP